MFHSVQHSLPFPHNEEWKNHHYCDFLQVVEIMWSSGECSSGKHKLQTDKAKARAEVICVYSAFGITDIFMEEVDSA